jgi:hypothetical protein
MFADPSGFYLLSAVVRTSLSADTRPAGSPLGESGITLMVKPLIMEQEGMLREKGLCTQIAVCTKIRESAQKFGRG